MARVMHAATGVMISIDGLTIVWYTLIELCALGKFVHSLGIWPKLKKKKNGTQICFRRGCAAEAAKPVPIFKGHFGGFYSRKWRFCVL